MTRSRTALRPHAIGFSLGNCIEESVAKTPCPKQSMELYGRYLLTVDGSVYDKDRGRYVVPLMKDEDCELVYRVWHKGKCISKTRHEWKVYYKENGGYSAQAELRKKKRETLSRNRAAKNIIENREKMKAKSKVKERIDVLR